VGEGEALACDCGAFAQLANETRTSETAMRRSRVSFFMPLTFSSGHAIVFFQGKTSHNPTRRFQNRNETIPFSERPIIVAG
jgi:hypothetical protein